MLCYQYDATFTINWQHVKGEKHCKNVHSKKKIKYKQFNDAKAKVYSIPSWFSVTFTHLCILMVLTNLRMNGIIIILLLLLKWIFRPPFLENRARSSVQHIKY